MSSIRAVDLTKSFTVGINKKINALKGVSFEIPEGEVTGYLGPNGSGKTTTFKIITGLNQQTSGQVFINNIPCNQTRSRKLLGYLPEGPYFYEHLTAEESLIFYGSLFGLKSKDIRKKAYDLLERFGILYAKDRKLQTYSKGMRQRLGFAQCLINDPQVIILDEPMSGLDPIGRKEFRDMILELKSKGKTILMASHVLNDVETICSRIILLSSGVIKEEGKISDLLAKTLKGTEIVFKSGGGDYLNCLPKGQYEVLSQDAHVTVNILLGAEINEVLQKLISANHQIIKVVPHNESLESYFIRLAKVSQ